MPFPISSIDAQRAETVLRFSSDLTRLRLEQDSFKPVVFSAKAFEQSSDAAVHGPEAVLAAHEAAHTVQQQGARVS